MKNQWRGERGQENVRNRWIRAQVDIVQIKHLARMIRATILQRIGSWNGLAITKRLLASNTEEVDAICSGEPAEK